METMICQYCNKEAVWCENKEIYGKNYGKSYTIWYCKPCDAYVGCHRNSKIPKGTLAKAELRKWRNEAHKIFDKRWKSKKRHTWKWERIKAYKWLARKLKVKHAHIGDCDIDGCKNIIRICQES